jgi:hypothetical protein
MTYDEGKCTSLPCFGGVHTVHCTAPRLSSTGMHCPHHENCRWREFPLFFMKRRWNDDAQIGNSKIPLPVGRQFFFSNDHTTKHLEEIKNSWEYKYYTIRYKRG